MFKLQQPLPNFILARWILNLAIVMLYFWTSEIEVMCRRMNELWKLFKFNISRLNNINYEG